MGVKSRAMAGARKLHAVHENDGDGATHGLAATHHTTRIGDPEDISGDGPVATHEPTAKNHENRGGGRTDGLAATHHTTRIADAEAVPPEIMETDGY